MGKVSDLTGLPIVRYVPPPRLDPPWAECPCGTSFIRRSPQRKYCCASCAARLAGKMKYAKVKR